MYRVGLTATWAVCVLAAGVTAWLGHASGLFRLAEVGPAAILTTLAPYLVLALPAWACRHRPVLLGILFSVAVLVSGYGLFFFVNDWYWPQPTNPNPWRVMMIPVVVVPQWGAVGLTIVTMMACRLWSTHGRTTGGDGHSG